MVKLWTPAIKFDNSNTWNLVVSDIMYFFCCLRPYCNSIQEASTHLKLKGALIKKYFCSSGFENPLLTTHMNASRQEALWMEVQLDMHRDVVRLPHWANELFQQLAPAKVDTEYAEEELFLMKL